MMLQRLVTGATGVTQARYRRRPTRDSEALARACAVYTHNATVRPAYEFHRGFCTLVLFIDSVDNVWWSGKAVRVELNQHRPWFVPIFTTSRMLASGSDPTSNKWS